MKYKKEMLKAKKIALDYEKKANENSKHWTIRFQSINGTPEAWFIAYEVLSESGSKIDGPLAMVIVDNGEIIGLDEYVMREKDKQPI